MKSGLLNLDNKTLVSLLNRIMALLGNSGLTGVDLICKKALLLQHFFFLLFVNLMLVSACPSLWCLYDDTACHILSFLHKFLSFSEIKFVPTYKTILLGSLHPEKIILHVFISLSVLKPST